MFQNKVIYQIYPKSFMDSDGDGVGDLQGVIDKLDYLQDLGIDMIWLTPFFLSPQVDNGYDIEDYYTIDPVFGSMAVFERLIIESKKRNIEIMLDMVLNHTSTKHAWFQKALSGDQEFMDYYFFREEPTNWVSKFGGSTWEYVPSLELYYLHLFDKTQADLNWENPRVFEQLCDVVNFWLTKGVKGLRFDVVNLISKPEVFQDDHSGDGRKYYTDGKNVHHLLHKLNRETFGKDTSILSVGEMSSTSIKDGVQYANPLNNELSTIFNFHHLKVDYKDNQKWSVQDFDFISLKKILSTWQLETMETNALLALFLNNHDQPRSVSRFGSERYHKQSAKMLASAIQSMRGIVYIYQGEEIGLPNAQFDALEDYKDIESLNAYNFLPGSHEEKMAALAAHSRDNGRTPMPWTNSKHYGFTEGSPWLNFSKSKALVSVADAIQDPDSIYQFYKRLISLRHHDPVYSKGNIEFFDLDHPFLFNYKRTFQDTTYLFINNFYEKALVYEHPNEIEEIILSNYDKIGDVNRLLLRPYECVVLKLK